MMRILLVGGLLWLSVLAYGGALTAATPTTLRIQPTQDKCNYQAYGTRTFRVFVNSVQDGGDRGAITNTNDADGFPIWLPYDITVFDLLPDTDYTIEVQCVDTTQAPSGPHEQLSGRDATVATTAQLTPPQNITILSKTDTSMTVNWDAGADTEGCTDWVITRDQDETTEVFVQFAGGCGITQLIVNGLTPETPYLFNVRAYNGVTAKRSPINYEAAIGITCEAP